MPDRKGPKKAEIEAIEKVHESRLMLIQSVADVQKDWTKNLNRQIKETDKVVSQLQKKPKSRERDEMIVAMNVLSSGLATVRATHLAAQGPFVLTRYLFDSLKELEVRLAEIGPPPDLKAVKALLGDHGVRIHEFEEDLRNLGGAVGTIYSKLPTAVTDAGKLEEK